MLTCECLPESRGSRQRLDVSAWVRAPLVITMKIEPAFSKTRESPVKFRVYRMLVIEGLRKLQSFAQRGHGVGEPVQRQVDLPDPKISDGHLTLKMGVFGLFPSEAFIILQCRFEKFL